AATLALSDFSVDGVRVRRARDRHGSGERLGREERGAHYGVVRRGRGGAISAGAGAGRAAGAGLRSAGFLAYEPELFSGAGGRAAADYLRGICVVPLGGAAMDLQPAGADGADVAACLLGAH